jgi:anti-sigma factor RsiW
MDQEAQLKLQAFLDGELSETEARAMADWVTRDPQAAALLAELRQTSALMAGFETGIKLPESREFFWSKIEREIQRLEKPAPAPAATPWLARLRRLLMPATALALITIAGFVATRQSGPHRLAAGVEIETALADTGTFTYRDYDTGTTLVWLSYPADREPADDEEVGIVQ